MRPEIADLARLIYPKLGDHDSVKGFFIFLFEKKRWIFEHLIIPVSFLLFNFFSRPDVKGVLKNLFFVDHKFLEKKEENMTKSNPEEANFVARFVDYLLKQVCFFFKGVLLWNLLWLFSFFLSNQIKGYAEDDVVVLTFYLGQQFAILDRLRRLKIKVRVSTVDDYQGEESKIIVFSSVRSNLEGKIGHCAVENRVCVAISRAREGFYMFGNSKTFWKSIENNKGLVIFLSFFFSFFLPHPFFFPFSFFLFPFSFRFPFRFPFSFFYFNFFSWSQKARYQKSNE